MPTRLQPQPTKPKPAPVRHLRPDPLLWREALRLAQGDPRRVEVLTPTEALVYRVPES